VGDLRLAAQKERERKQRERAAGEESFRAAHHESDPNIGQNDWQEGWQPKLPVVRIPS
jgi:hypothetical protein